MAATVATNVNGTVMTSSPGPTPAASSDRCSALVPLLTPIASDVRQNVAKSCSKAATDGPRMNCALSKTRATAASISSLNARYCAGKSTNGIMTPSGPT